MEKKIVIKEDICKKCDFCVEVCPKQIFIKNNGDIPGIDNEQKCIECGQCLAICPVDAIDYPTITKGIAVEKPGNIDLDIKSLFLSVRSVRKYKDKAISKGEVEELIRIASLAPCASNTRDVSYYILMNNETIRQLENAVINHFRSLLKLFNPAIRGILAIFSGKLYTYVKKMIPALTDLVLKYDKGLNPIFHNAPAVILFAAPKVNRMSKDNVDGQVHYFRLAAHIKGYSSCIIGYAVSSHKNVEKKLNIPEDQQVFGVLTLGYPKYKYSKAIERKLPDIVYI